MKFYENWIRKKEQEGLSEKMPIKNIHQFYWGLEYIGLDKNDSNPKEAISSFIDKTLKNSDEYFVPRELPLVQYTLENGKLIFPSSIVSSFKENNIVTCHYFPSDDKENIIIVVPHWNADGEKYDKMCRLMKMINFSSLRIVMPYHEERDPKGPPDSTLMVSANIGMTLQAMRQTVQDIILSINWLKIQGYKKIGIMSASLGSCAAFLAAAHDNRINGLFANFMSSYFGDVVWTGESTLHVKKSIEKYLTVKELRKFWLLNSPIAFVDQLKKRNPSLKQFIVCGRYDTTFQFYLTNKMFDAYDEKNIEYQKLILPCGHYTLGKYLFKFIDGYQILKFFNKILR